MHTVDTHDVVALLNAQRELLELPTDPTQRTTHAMRQLSKLLNTTGSMFVRVDETPASGGFSVMDSLDVGIESTPERAMMTNCYIQDPPNPLHEPLMTAPGNLVVLDRRDILSNTAWHSCGFYTDVSRKVRAEEIMCVRVYMPFLRRNYGIAVFRPPGDPAFNRRDRDLISLYFTQVLPIIRQRPKQIVHDLSDLAPRYRPIVESLLAGDSPKQIALKHGYSLHTVYAYIKQLYKQMDVTSRGEFLARWHARQNNPIMQVHA